MKEIFTFSFLFYFLAISACKTRNDRKFKYSTLVFDTTNTYVFGWDSTRSRFPPFSEPLALNNNDIKIADSLMNDAIGKFNNANSKAFFKSFNGQVPIDSFTIDGLKYKRQLFPYKDNNGKRIIYLVGFSRLFPAWRSIPYYGGNATGYSEFRITINLSDTTANDFSIGGFG